MRKRLFLCSPEPRAAGTVESPEPREGQGRGGKLDRRLSETGESTARIAQGCGGGGRLRKWLVRWSLGGGPVIGARDIGGDLGNPGRGCRANLSQSLHQTILRFPPLLPLPPLRTIVTLVSFMNADWEGTRNAFFPETEIRGNQVRNLTGPRLTERGVWRRARSAGVPNPRTIAYLVNSSLTSERSSFNSLTVASILARLKSFRGRSGTISSFCPLLRSGNEQINPCSMP